MLQPHVVRMYTVTVKVTVRKVTFTQCTQLLGQLRATTASTNSAEHHMQLYTVLFSWRRA